MKRIKKHSDELDQFFKEGLNDFQVPPPGKEGKEEHPLDDLFRSQLDQYEVTPSPEVWDKVKTRIPLSLQMKRQLTWWTKIAAALILGLTVTVAIKEYQKANAQDIVVEEIKEAVPVVPIDDFVYPGKEESDVAQQKQQEPTAREMFEEDEDVVADIREIDIKPLDPIETKVDGAKSLADNPLDDKQKEAIKHGKLPLRTDKTGSGDVMLGLGIEDKQAEEDQEKQ